VQGSEPVVEVGGGPPLDLACTVTVAYWVVATLLALVYLYSGGLKVLRSPGRPRPMAGWIDAMPLRLVRTMGVLEVLGALGSDPASSQRLVPWRRTCSSNVGSRR
jgi:hypothetical protein